jgi:hypothetical protein
MDDDYYSIEAILTENQVCPARLRSILALKRDSETSMYLRAGCP